MRLLDTYTGQFVEKDPRDSETKYAILSHTWDRGGEQTYQQLQKIQERYASTDWNKRAQSKTPRSRIWDDEELSPKIRDACAVARANGFAYIWIDSCCIDKASSSELSEAINSMYAWYSAAVVCYAYLGDVPTEDELPKNDSCFRNSRWFTRGWTLQELLAPRNLVFLSKEWKVLGSKLTLVGLVHSVSNINHEALLQPESLDNFSVSQRLSWASCRETARVEDRAYSLLGLFNIHMPTLYGEGERAFRRLQEEIMRRTPDQTLFAWRDVYLGPPIPLKPVPTASHPSSQRFVCQLVQLQPTTSLLAVALDSFWKGGSIDAVPHGEVVHRLRQPNLLAPDYNFTPHGIRTRVPMIPLSRYLPIAPTQNQETPLGQWYLVILGSEHKDLPGHLLGRVCRITPSDSGVEFLNCGYVRMYSEREAFHSEWVDLFPLSPDVIEDCVPFIELKTVYISHPHRASAADPYHPHDAAFQAARTRLHETINLLLKRESHHALRSRGYTVALRSPNEDHPTTHQLTLTSLKHIITIEYRHSLADDTSGQRLTIEAYLSLSDPEPRAVSSGTTHSPSHPKPNTTSLSWTDRMPWSARVCSNDVVALSTAGGLEVAVVLGVDFIAKDYYLLRVHIRED